MKIGIYIILTFLFFGSCYFVGVTMKSPQLAYAIGLIMILLFSYNLIRHSKKAAQKRYRERMFLRHMQMTYKNQWY